MRETPSYNIVDRFVSIQGEGTHTGKNMQFIRLFGCNLACTFCDEPTHKDKEAIEQLTANDIVCIAQDSKVDWVCITGGEPSLQDLNPLILLLQYEGFKVMVETNGLHYENVQEANHVCLSPKAYPIPEGRWDSMKLLIDDSYNTQDLKTALRTAEKLGAEIFFQPINSEVEVSEANLRLCIELMRRWPSVGLSVQLHKILGVE